MAIGVYYFVYEIFLNETKNIQYHLRQGGFTLPEAQNDMKLEIARLFQELGLILKQNMRKEFEDFDMTMPQTMVIGKLMNQSPMKIGELSEKLGFTNSTTSGILDRLEKQGIVERERSSEDRRVVFVSISKDFCKHHVNFPMRINSIVENLLQTAEEDELERILDGLILLKNVLEKGQSQQDQELKSL